MMWLWRVGVVCKVCDIMWLNWVLFFLFEECFLVLRMLWIYKFIVNIINNMELIW